MVFLPKIERERERERERESMWTCAKKYFKCNNQSLAMVPGCTALPE